MFAAHLISHQFITKQSADSLTMVRGISTYQKVGHLLGVVDKRLRASRNVGETFKVFLSILSIPLGLRDIAKQMETECCTCKSYIVMGILGKILIYYFFFLSYVLC